MLSVRDALEILEETLRLDQHIVALRDGKLSASVVEELIDEAATRVYQLRHILITFEEILEPHLIWLAKASAVRYLRHTPIWAAREPKQFPVLDHKAGNYDAEQDAAHGAEREELNDLCKGRAWEWALAAKKYMHLICHRQAGLEKAFGSCDTDYGWRWKREIPLIKYSGLAGVNVVSVTVETKAAALNTPSPVLQGSRNTLTLRTRMIRGITRPRADEKI